MKPPQTAKKTVSLSVFWVHLVSNLVHQYSKKSELNHPFHKCIPPPDAEISFPLPDVVFGDGGFWHNPTYEQPLEWKENKRAWVNSPSLGQEYGRLSNPRALLQLPNRCCQGVQDWQCSRKNDAKQVALSPAHISNLFFCGSKRCKLWYIWWKIEFQGSSQQAAQLKCIQSYRLNQRLQLEMQKAKTLTSAVSPSS